MRIYRVYDIFSLPAEEINLNKENSHHLGTVLRCKIGEFCHVFDGHGNELKTEILVIARSQITLRVLEKIDNQTESPLKIHLFQALCKNDKMDTIIQKAIELGVSEITPITTERCDVKLSGDRLENKMTHWRNIIINATEQSGRAVLAHLNSPLSLQEGIQQQAENLCLLFTPHTEKKLSDLSVPENNNVTIFIGPEGGFSEPETAWAINQKVETVVLGKRVLRTETAPIAIIASLQTLWGDFQ